MNKFKIIQEFLATSFIHSVGVNIYFITKGMPHQRILVPLGFAGAVFLILISFGFNNGVSINPIVSCNNYFNGLNALSKLLSELLTQAVANLLAQYCLGKIYASNINVAYRYNIITVLIFEVIATYVLLFTINRGRQRGYSRLRYSICIASIVVLNGVLIGPISGAMTNPFLTLSLFVFCEIKHAGYILFICCPFIALTLFRYSDKHTCQIRRGVRFLRRL